MSNETVQQNVFQQRLMNNKRRHKLLTQYCWLLFTLVDVRVTLIVYIAITRSVIAGAVIEWFVVMIVVVANVVDSHPEQSRHEGSDVRTQHVRLFKHQHRAIITSRTVL